MMQTIVLFVHGAGEGAYEEDEPLVTSLRDALGGSYEVRYPRMPLEESAQYSDWTARISSELPAWGNELVLVGHSVGGSVLLRLLCEELVEAPVAGLFVIAAPFWGADDFWDWDEARLPEDAAEKLAAVPRIFLYHSRDDEVVPFSHLALYSARLPRASIQPVGVGGHQLGKDLAVVARDIAESTLGREKYAERLARNTVSDRSGGGLHADQVRQRHGPGPGARASVLHKCPRLHEGVGCARR
jgi:predicted alpha/beta hydrolase family esterase